MPITRRRFRPKRRIPRNKMFRRRPVYRRRGPSKIHYFKRTVKISDVTASYNSATGVSTQIAGAYVLSLDTLPNYTEFTTLYDQYMIKGVKLSFVPSASAYMNNTLSGSPNPLGWSRFHSAIDWDDSTTPANENVILQYSTLKTTPGWKQHSRYFRPKVRQAAVIDTTTGAMRAVTANRSPWLDCDSPDVEHYGLKVFCAAPVNTTVSTSITYSVYATVYVAMKNVR